MTDTERTLQERLRIRASHQRKNNGGGDGMTHYTNADAVLDDKIAARLDALEAERDDAIITGKDYEALAEKRTQEVERLEARVRAVEGERDRLREVAKKHGILVAQKETEYGALSKEQSND